VSHPSLAEDVLLENLGKLVSGELPDLFGREVAVGDGQPIDLSGLEECVSVIRGTLDQRLAGTGPLDLDDDQFEGAMAAELHRCLVGFELDVLDDPGFWRYLASAPLWFFTRWREDPAERKPETYHVYVDGTKNDSCVPLRMFLRAQAVVRDGDYRLASSIRKGTDFWRSHIIRVKTSTKPELARAVAREQEAERMRVNLLRDYAKRINRRWTNEVLYILDENECREIADAERDSAAS